MPTQNTYIYNTTGIGLVFTADSQTWTIAKGVFVGSKTNSGVYSAYDSSKLVNKGHIHSDSAYGLEFIGSYDTIVNKAGADIYGSNDAIVIAGQHNAIINHGTVVGSEGDGIFVYDAPHASVTNDGEIYGHITGVEVQSTVVGAHGTTIDNSGFIHADIYGIFINTDPAEKTTIVNEQGGTIKGGTTSISVLFGKLHLENHGTIRGGVYAATLVGARDKVVNYGTIKGDVFLGSGNDVYKSKGGHAHKVDGGLGNDKLVGGAHVDKFVFDTALNATTNVDTVRHFTPGTDKFFLDNGVFTSLTGTGTLKKSEFHIGKHAGDHNDYIIYNQHNGGLYYDPDGSGSTYGKVKFAQLDKGLHLHHGDFMVFA